MSCNGNIILNGITSGSDSVNDAGIVINNNIINNRQYNIILNGGTTLYNTSGKGIYNKPGIKFSGTGNFEINPYYSSNNGVSSSYFSFIEVTTSPTTSPTKKIQTWKIVLIVILVLLLILGIILTTTIKIGG